MEKNENKMGHAPIGKLLFSMSLPAMFSMLVQACYNVVDSIFVAQLGEDALTAVSLAFPIQMLMVAVAVGTAIGINSLISRRLGAKHYSEANMVASHGVILLVLSWVLFALFGLFGTRAFIAGFTDNAAIIEMGTQYGAIVTIFAFGAFVETAISRTLQATGNMTYPMISQIIGAVVNIILDPIMIFGLCGCPALGVRGAALATVIGQIVAMFFAVYIITHKKFDVHISFKNFKFSSSIVFNIYAVGFPSIIMQAIGSFLIVCLNTILMGLSGAAVAVLGVYYKLQSFVFMPVFGLTQGAMPILGYNFGARDKKRLLDCLKLTAFVALAIMTAGTALFWGCTELLLTLFNASSEMLEIGIPALRTISLCFIPAALGISFSTMFQAIGHGIKSLIMSLLRQLFAILPLAWFFARFFTLNEVWMAFPIAEIVSLIACAFMFISAYRKEIAHL
ncbi:MAG: MATE family efflux transporter [Oscillospiraceae bacterium]|nr:MATE family efflux transporter [Oscillospiraceae bacterium]